jgi:hypothetical protein
MSTAVLNIKILADAKQASDTLRSTGKETSKFSKGLGVASKAAGVALVGVAAFAVKAGKAAAEDAQSQALLAKALQNSTGASTDQIAATEDWISSMSAATGVADDELRPALATLARASGDTEKAQKDLAFALDVAAATGKSVESVSEAIAKGYSGQTMSLGKLVPGIDKATLATKDMDKIMAAMATKTQGSAAAAADTTAGKMQRMQLAMDETTESIGGALLPVMAKLSTVMLALATAAQAHPKLFQAIAAAVVVLSVAVIALNFAIKLYSIAVQLAGEATVKAWLTALGPIGAVIAIVLVVIALVVILWKRSETFRRITTAAFKAVQTAAKAVWQWLKRNWPLLLAILTGPIGLAVLAIAKNWDKIKAGATAVKDWVVAKFDAVWTAVSGVFTKITDKFTALRDFVKDLKIPNPLTPVISAFNTLIGLVDDLVEKLRNIKVPSIKLPFGIGPQTAAAGFAVPAGSSFAAGRATPLVRTAAAGGSAPTINIFALDPEGSARAVRRVLADHDRRVGVRPR